MPNAVKAGKPLGVRSKPPKHAQSSITKDQYNAYTKNNLKLCLSNCSCRFSLNRNFFYLMLSQIHPFYPDAFIFLKKLIYNYLLEVILFKALTVHLYL